MVKFYKSSYYYEYSWPIVTLAWFLRYPNPYSKHVVSVDVVDRYVDNQGCLRTTRLILKDGKLPKWGAKLFKISQSYILEDSIVNLESNEMHTFIRNLDHTKVMKVVENQTYSVSHNNSCQTFVNVTAQIKSSFGWGFTNKIEKFGVIKFSKNLINSRAGMTHVLKVLRDNGWAKHNNMFV
ncbi:hypothetical protein PNEG_01897 [Pneumocystis murina B123]|uniref:PRELI/MSF1 domain-containing protein n=1 Tax=Pneumocystis murina (strain B123) TaxID=1069680 RepID=M7P761_PNEMU|nr:hypothetical protein PNEG_01897 [Pneumocystis murina B123]EMR09710.1 hypothetical protein PNEG_01897 [Pneumocystis murina B123]